ncbi:MAG: dTMP kinase [bacterium]
MVRGSLITFEGIDFSGKTVQANLLKERLIAEGLPVVFLREPGGTEISEKIREVLLDTNHHKMVAATEVLLYAAARAQLVAESVIPQLKKGSIVICDRYYDSTTAYQGYARKIDLAFIKSLNKFVSQKIEPDLTFLLDLEPEKALRRKDLSASSPDRLEREDLKFHKRVREGYLDIARREPHRFIIINGDRPINLIQEEIFKHTKSRLKI